MSPRNRFFVVIVAAVFAAQFTLGVLNWAFWIVQSNTPGLDDPDALFRLATTALLAILFWGVAVWMWGRARGDMIGA
jgi:hypothetical protein